MPNNFPVCLTKTVTLPDNVNVNSKKKTYLQASNRISSKFMYGTTRKHWAPSLILSLLDYAWARLPAAVRENEPALIPPKGRIKTGPGRRRKSSLDHTTMRLSVAGLLSYL